jgi:hypothetical protein
MAADSNSRKKENDKNTVDLLHQIHCDDVSVNASIRLGKLQQGPDIKPRPVKLDMSSEAQKDKSLLNAKHLKGNSNGLDMVFIHQNLTP